MNQTNQWNSIQSNSSPSMNQDGCGNSDDGWSRWITFSADGDELDAFAGDKVEGLVDVGDLVEAHLAAVGLGQRLARDHLQEQHQLQAVAEVILDVFDARSRLAQVRVAPRGKRLINPNKQTNKQTSNKSTIIHFIWLPHFRVGEGREGRNSASNYSSGWFRDKSAIRRFYLSNKQPMAVPRQRHLR